MTGQHAPGRMEDGVDRPGRFTFHFDGQVVEAFQGETIGAALWAAGIRDFRHSVSGTEVRGLYCAMGVCFDCLVLVHGQPIRACMAEARPGLEVRRGGTGKAQA